MVRRPNAEDNMPCKRNHPAESAIVATPAANTSRIRRAPPALTRLLKSNLAGIGGEEEVLNIPLPAPEEAPDVVADDPFKPKTVVVNGRTISQKHAMLLALVQRSEGATLDELRAASGWQKHSVRGFIAGFVKKVLGLSVLSTRTAEGARCYRVPTEVSDASA
jgi:hypothetical protein